MSDQNEFYYIGYRADTAAIDTAVDSIYERGGDKSEIEEIARGAYAAFKEGRDEGFSGMIADGATQAYTLSALKDLPKEELDKCLNEALSGINDKHLEFMFQRLLGETRDNSTRQQDALSQAIANMLNAREEAAERERQMSVAETTARFAEGVKANPFNVAGTLARSWTNPRPPKTYSDMPEDEVPQSPRPTPVAPRKT